MIVTLPVLLLNVHAVLRRRLLLRVRSYIGPLSIVL